MDAVSWPFWLPRPLQTARSKLECMAPSPNGRCKVALLLVILLPSLGDRDRWGPELSDKRAGR